MAEQEWDRRVTRADGTEAVVPMTLWDLVVTSSDAAPDELVAAVVVTESTGI